jgi:putative membrane protein
MLLQFILAILCGVSAGTITGLIPGIHINLIGIMLVSLSFSLFSTFEPLYLVTFIAAMAITHTFLDFIPSIFLGCPDTDTELSVLPGHELLKQGQGYSAIMFTTYGSLAAIFLLIIIAYPSILGIAASFETIKQAIPYILILVSLLLIFSEKKKFKAFLVFAITGFLGLAVLHPQANLNLYQPLLPLLTGLFGASALILTIKNKTKIPEQKIQKEKTPLFRPLIGALIASPLCSFLPGLGAGQAAIIGNTISRTDKKGFLVLLGATNTLVMGFSFISFYIISKTRTGATVAIKEILGFLSQNTLILILFTILISGIISFFLTKKIALIATKNITRIKYTSVSLATLAVLVIIVFLVSGFLGLFVLAASTIIGLYSITRGVRRTNMMGALLIPTIILYLF